MVSEFYFKKAVTQKVLRTKSISWQNALWTWPLSRPPALLLYSHPNSTTLVAFTMCNGFASVPLSAPPSATMLAQHPVVLIWFIIASSRALSLAPHSGWLLTGKHFPRSPLCQYLFSICLPIRWKHWESMSGGTRVSLLSITMPDTLASSLFGEHTQLIPSSGTLHVWAPRRLLDGSLSCDRLKELL